MKGLLWELSVAIHFIFVEEDERAYFLKTQAARKQHYMSRRKRKRTRGQDKVVLL